MTYVMTLHSIPDQIERFSLKHRIYYRALDLLPRILVLFESFPTTRLPSYTKPETTSKEVPGCIPLVVRQTWQSNALGRKHALSRQAFVDLNPEFSFEFYDDAQMSQYMQENWGSTCLGDAFERAMFGPLKTDLFRYCITFDKGGFYCDISKGIGRPIATMISKDAKELLSFEKNTYDLPVGKKVENEIIPLNRVINYAFGFERHHPILNTLLNQICEDLPDYFDKVFANPKDAIISLTGPVALSRAIFNFIEEGTSSLKLNFRGVDFEGSGIFALPGSYFRYWKSPSYLFSKPSTLFRSSQKFRNL